METEKKACNSCKFISICCFCGIGSYLIHIGRSYPKRSKLLMNLLGLGSFGLGIGETFDISPLKRNTKESS